MNIIPSELIAVPNYDGYFWHPAEETVYSMKVTGTLKPLTRTKPWRSPYRYHPVGFRLSRKGRDVSYPLEFFRKLTPKDYIVPYKK